MKSGDVQRISAGTGIAHSEYNNSNVEQVHFLQIWLAPSRKGLKPDYAQQSFANAPSNMLALACSPDGHNKSIKINQDVELFIGKLAPKAKINHSIKEHRGVWIQLIDGDLFLQW
jgi:redox-sensitive bicupin YhaK (pirin superfamily)